MQKPFFSVVIPLYNKQNFIEATLNSVLCQTFTDFEIIIVNDVSTDDSLNVAHSIKDGRIRIINHTVNKGLSASRNTGIKNAAADYIAFLDADDLWEAGFLSSIHKLTQKYPKAGIYASRYKEVYNNDISIDIPPVKESGIINLYSVNLKKPILCSSCICIRKDVFENTGYYDETITFSEDIDLYIRAAFKYETAYCNSVLASYMIYDANQITNLGIKNKVIPDFDKYEYLSKERPDIKTYLDFHRYIMAKQYKLSNDSAGFKKMLHGINLKSLNYKQIILLYSPALVLRLIKELKKVLVKKGINPTTY